MTTNIHVRAPANRLARRAQTLVEYSLIIALLAIILITSVMGFGFGVQRNLSDSDSELQRAYNRR